MGLVGKRLEARPLPQRWARRVRGTPASFSCTEPVAVPRPSPAGRNKLAHALRLPVRPVVRRMQVVHVHLQAVRRANSTSSLFVRGHGVDHGAVHVEDESLGTGIRPHALLGSEAWMNTSRSPSSTFWVAETSTLVRRSLMRLLVQHVASGSGGPSRRRSWCLPASAVLPCACAFRSRTGG